MSGPLFVMVVARCMGTEEYNWWSYLALVPIMSGVALSAAAEENFTWPGISSLLVYQIFFALRQNFVAREFLKEPNLRVSELLMLASTTAGLLLLFLEFLFRRV